jgi:hypothetical protein
MPTETLDGVIHEGRIYKANGMKNGCYFWNNNESWAAEYFKEISQAKAFVLLKGNIDLVEELF